MGGRSPTAPSLRPPQEFALAYAQALLEDGRIDEADRAARFAMRYAQAAAMVDKLVEPQWRKQQREYEAWRQIWRGDLDLQDELIQNSLKLQEEIRSIRACEEELSADGCCRLCATALYDPRYADDHAGEAANAAPAPECSAAPGPAPASVIDDGQPTATDPPP